ncbi:MAG: thymidine phosphorylase [Candidatus Melainabacteria bacterium]|nr:thymidine phosphorylase [Candidatus Melainabacteria bacterium]
MQTHTKEEINYFIKNLNTFSQDKITKWLKEVKENGLTNEETTSLTLAMVNSGETLNWEGLEPTIDKHSTGGIGDKVTLLFAPLVAACGINVPKLSGRALGITGGTIDKLESIPSFRTNLQIDEIKNQVKKIGLAISSASANLAPADKKLYAIRDVTNTVDSIPLIASSIMSKKIAGGSKNIILDVKFGSGAFMKSFHDAKLLARAMVNIGQNLGRNVKAIISDMDQPLGYAIGNALEVKEVIDVLSGKEVTDLVEIVISLAKCIDFAPMADSDLKEILLGGKALRKFKEMVIAQDGDLKLFSNSNKAKHIEVVKSERDGYVHKIDALSVGKTVHTLGAGRKKVSDSIDHSVGILFFKKYGDKVKNGEVLFEVHSKNKEDAESAKKTLTNSVLIKQEKPQELKLIHDII